VAPAMRGTRSVTPDAASLSERPEDGVDRPLGASLHHVSLVTRDLDRACAFYESVFGLRRVPRPPFASEGAWYAVGPLTIHLTLHPEGTYRSKARVDPNDGHFALRVTDFDGLLRRLAAAGYREGVSDDPKGLIVKRGGVAGYHQAFLFDPDLNQIEVNAAF
jgi:glyoxylase I family protein